MPFVVNFFQLSGIYQQTYSIDALTVAMTFVVIIFHLPGIYKQTWFINNIVFNYIYIYIEQK